MKNNRILFTVLFMILFAPCMIFSAEAADEGLGIARYAIYVGSNEGGGNTQRLLYAETDAISFQKTMTEIGGIPYSNGILLLDPSKSDLDDALNTVSAMINKNRQNSKRSEFVFYYSGHSDENALLLGRSTYGYSELKAAISNVPSDVHVVILDSCYSGNFIRIKGGQKKKPFLLDDSTVVKGHAYLSSSSSQEFAQESSEIGSSFFTNAILTGLRGAADSSGDKKITLNELYSYAFSETLSKTENSSVGPQHPNYNITLVGSGDLVLSDISNSDSIVLLSKNLNGRILIRNKNGKLISEINKISGTPVYLALEKGDYNATLIAEKATLQGNFTVTSGKVYELSEKSFEQISTASNRVRGEEKNESEIAFNLEEDEQFIPFEFSFVTNEFSSRYNKKVVTPVSFSILHSKVYKANAAMFSFGVNEADYAQFIQAALIYNAAKELKGVQASVFYNRADDIHGVQASAFVNSTGDIHGVQGSGIVNMADHVEGVQGAGIVNTTHYIHGIQGAGLVNKADDVKGLQISGIVNKAKDVNGMQIGFINIADEVHGLQLGVLNLCKNGVLEIGTSFTSNRNMRFFFNSGTQYLYGILGGMVSGRYMFSDYEGKYDFRLMYGLGSRLQKGMFDFDIEILRIASNEKDNDDDVDDDHSYSFTFDGMVLPSLRLAAGITPIKHVNFFAGATFAFYHKDLDNPFENLEKNITIDCSDDFKIYPEFEVGIRYSFR